MLFSYELKGSFGLSLFMAGWYLVVGILIIVTAIIFVIVYYAFQLWRRAFQVTHCELNPQTKVLSIGDGKVVLAPHKHDVENFSLPIVGVKSETGYATLSDDVVDVDTPITRRILRVSGALHTGQLVKSDRFAFPSDPFTAHRVNYETVFYKSPAGQMPAWHIPGSSNIWAITVHGHRSWPGESLRVLPIFVNAGLPTLCIYYRNDAGCPKDSGGYHTYGLKEWEDLEGALKTAIDRGASGIILLGHSMGGGIVWNFLMQSRFAHIVIGCILESPVLDLNQIVETAAKTKYLPNWCVAITKRVVGRIVGVNWDDFRYIDSAHKLKVPTLLIHSASDQTVPVHVSDEFARQRSDLVRYLRIKEAPHAAAWNCQSSLVESELEFFIQSLVSDGREC